MHDWEKFQTAYKNASPHIKKLVDSTTIPSCVKKEMTDNGIDSKHQKILVKIFTDYVLGMTEKTLVSNALASLGISNSNHVFTRVEQNIHSAQEYIDSALDFENAGSVIIHSQNTLTADIAETEAILAGAPHVRTMARDMHDLKSQADHLEPSHVSSQAHTLEASMPPKPPIPIPQPAVSARITNPNARWGSEVD